MNHLEDDAELYALGLIGPEREPEIEAHLAECGACRDRVIAAEAAAAALSSTIPAAPALASVTPLRRRWTAGLAAAAAVALAATAAFEGSAAHTASLRLAATNTALLAMAGSHFEHVSLTTATPGTVAKAIYARDGAWYYVVVSSAPPNAHVRVTSNGSARDVGTLTPGTPATLFVRGVGRVASIDVAAGGTTVARGEPRY